VGQRITEDAQSYEVVGVVHDLKSGFVTGQGSAVMYLPLTGTISHSHRRAA